MKSALNEKPKVLAIIPARGGSKGIPRKNIRDLCGKPLIAYSIESALKSNLIDRVVVSTDDEEIAEVSKNYGADVPFLRPKELAQDRSDLGKAVDFTANRIWDDGFHQNILVTLFPTHPFRTLRLINHLIKKAFIGHALVTTVKAIKHDFNNLFYKEGGKHLRFLLDIKAFNGNTGPHTFFRTYGTFLASSQHGKLKPYVYVLKDPITLIDIDNIHDFFLAEEIIKEGLFDFSVT